MELSPEHIRAVRLRAQRLEPRADRAALVETVRAVVGIQAQLTPAMLLALRVRTRGLTVQDVQSAIDPERRLVRAWAMRGTLHLLAREDLDGMLAVFGPVFAAKDRRRRLQLGLTDDLCSKGVAAIADMLKQGEPLTRGEIVEQLAARGMVLERKSQAPIHLIAYAALQDAICLGPERPNGESTYVSRAEWFGQRTALDRDEALTELVPRYLSGYGPASLHDFAGWSGLPLADAKKGWRSVTVGNGYIEVRSGSQVMWMPEGAKDYPLSSSPVVRLLPAFDAYLLGYGNRDNVVLPKHQSEVYHGGQIVPVVLVDGLAAGTWRYERKGKRLAISVRAFDDFDAAVRQGIEEEAEDIGRFFELPVTLTAQP